jgi:hypothetical protein
MVAGMFLNVAFYRHYLSRSTVIYCTCTFAVGRENQEHASVLLLRVWGPLQFHLLPLLEAQKRKKVKANTTRKNCDSHLSTV